MKWLKTTVIIIFVFFLLFAAAKLLGAFSAKEKSSGFVFTEIQRGDIRSVISSTGVLEPIETIEVGTQVSGTISKVMVDFNDLVKKGDLLALLDTAILKINVKDAEASLKKALAQLNLKKLELEKNQRLFDDNLVSKDELLISETQYEQAAADVMSSETTLERALTNLNYTKIFSPIDGIIISRNVDAGQTVAASFSTPRLFIIAKDLKRMQILAYVDESDIGRIRNDMQVEFIVPAYPYDKFPGKVEQIRLQPESVSNVVNYIVVIKADNSSGKLLPGMTATVDFIVEEVHDVLMIPNAALRFKPTEKMLETVRSSKEKHTIKDSLSEGTGKSSFSGGMHGSPGAGGKAQIPGTGKLWYIDKDHNIKIAVVQLGASDGKFTEIKSGDNIAEGMQVILGISIQSGKSAITDKTVQRQQQRLGLF
ncbi:efflux RND transporter periplasmic adaptor subunit [bacterium]|nr:efflux RND transporter periplasmic adaptor subunit [FCB group bacterium]MBL7190516.1 efflux RND transporter periplasmic adaptor subunit [bacterium]